MPRKMDTHHWEGCEHGPRCAPLVGSTGPLTSQPPHRPPIDLGWCGFVPGSAGAGPVPQRLQTRSAPFFAVDPVYSGYGIWYVSLVSTTSTVVDCPSNHVTSI